MKPYLIIVILFAVATGCSDVQKVDQQSSTLHPSATEQAQEQTAQKASAQLPFNGTYFFDTEKYKTEQLKHDGSVFKKMKPRDLERMMSVFRPFKIEVAGNKATASFSNDVIQGTLTKRPNGAGTHLFMTPDDEAKKDQTVTLIIEGDNLILDPGRKETDKMFFRRSAL